MFILPCGHINLDISPCYNIAMSTKLSVLMITKNAAETLEKSLASVKKIADEIIIVDSKSTDRTVEIVRKVLKVHKVYKVFVKEFADIGRQRIYGLNKAIGDWILILDSDEVVSKELSKEIFTLLNGYIVKENGFYIRYQNHYLGRSLKYGGENYKMLRLFKRNKLLIKSSLVHNKIELISGKVGKLEGKILHFSYRSIPQIFSKFTDYGVRMAKEKRLAGEKSSLKKVFLYPPHLFWARFIKDKGYQDGLFRIPLDLGFAYMEFIIYISLAFLNIKNKKLKI